MKVISTIVKILIVLMLLVAIMGVIVYFGGYDFFVTCEGETIFDVGGGFTMTKDEPLRVDVGYVKATGSKAENKSYSVRVVPNPINGKDFDFVMNNSIYSFQAEPDLTDGFMIEENDTYFTIAPKGGVTQILRAVHPNSAVEDCRTNAYDNMYSILIYSNDGDKYVKLNFSIIESLEGVELDKEAIQF